MISIMTFTILLYLLLLILGVLMFQQEDFKLVFERVEIVRFNSSYVSHLTTHNFKYNRTTAVVNITVGLKLDFGRDLKIEVQAYKWASNEYRLFPMRFMFDFCDYATKNEFGLGELYKSGNLTRCPMKKGIYHIGYWAPNGTKFPPHLPGGPYLLDLKFFYQNVEAIFYQGYAIIKYPVVKGFAVFQK